jgi:ribosomal-protein-alanine N-acetyltransferase
MVEIETLSYPEPWSEQLLAQSLAAPMTFSRGILWDSQCVGYAIFQIILEETHLLNVAVDPRFRGRGLGRQLLMDLEEQARLRDSRLILLEVRPSNQGARRIYESLGYEQTGRRERYYQDGEAALILLKTLKN